jgi:hypothetical protein
MVGRGRTGLCTTMGSKARIRPPGSMTAAKVVCICLSVPRVAQQVWSSWPEAVLQLVNRECPWIRKAVAGENVGLWQLRPKEVVSYLLFWQTKGRKSPHTHAKKCNCRFVLHTGDVVLVCLG